MSQRLNYAAAIPQLINKLMELGQPKDSSLGESLLGLIHNRASQLNGCAFCLDMDVKQAKLRGESELRMYHISVWRDSPLFSPRERAALEWTDTLTRLPADGVRDEVFGRVREHFSDKELAELTLAIGLVNVWNRLNVAFTSVPGSLDKAFGLDKAGLK